MFETSVGKFNDCALEFDILVKTLGASFKSIDKFAVLKAKLDSLIAKNKEHLKQATKYKFFLHVYKNTYCQRP